MRDTLPLLDKISFPAHPARQARNAADQCRLSLQPVLRPLPRQCRAEPHRGNDRRSRRPGAGLSSRARRSPTLDITGGAPELNPHFRRLVREARKLGVKVMDRCNLTILEQPGQEDLAEFLAGERVEVVASMPCYLRGQCRAPARQRRVRRLDPRARGGSTRSATAATPRSRFNLVYNPQGPSLPPPQAALEADYKRMLGEHYGIVFNKLYTLANMPIQRFGSMLVTRASSTAIWTCCRTPISTPISTA